MGWRLAFVLVALGLAGCTSGGSTEAPAPLTLDSTDGALHTSTVLRGNTTVIAYALDLPSPTTVRVAWLVGDGGVGSACAHSPQAFEDWQVAANPGKAHEPVCSTGNRQGSLAGELPAGKFFLAVAAYECPALDCRLEARFDAPVSPIEVFKIDRDNPWAVTPLS